MQKLNIFYAEIVKFGLILIHLSLFWANGGKKIYGGEMSHALCGTQLQITEIVFTLFKKNQIFFEVTNKINTKYIENYKVHQAIN